MKRETVTLSRLTALAIWILGSLILVFIALILYVFILVNMRRMAKKTTNTGSEEKSKVDFDSIFLLAHPTLDHSNSHFTAAATPK